MSIFSGLSTKNEYRLIRLLFKNPNSEIYLAGGQAESQQFVLKKSLVRSISPTETNPVNWEYEILKPLSHPGIPVVYELASDGKSLALIEEFIDGKNLREHLFNGKPDPSEALKISLQLAESLQYIHDQDIIHRDLNPENIMITTTGEVKIIDFASSITKRTSTSDAPVSGHLEGSLCYISPEQTGRTTFSISPASDFYSLGIVMYEMLAGKPPFDSADPLEIIHFHLSRKPIALGAIVKELPSALDKIVTKLLQKDPADRYRTAQGLIADLARVSKHHKQGKPLLDFQAGRLDRVRRYQKIQKLYGRDADVEQLLRYYAHLDELKSILVLISGYSGVGKSALVAHLKPQLVAENGIFLSGKFDQFKKDIPYYAFIEAIQDFIKNLLSQPEAIIARWRKRILNVLGENAPLIVEVIPLLSKIIEVTETVVKLQPAEQESRFNKVLLDFIYVFASAENPLVLFLDDLQWADLSSLNLVKRILQHSRKENIFILSAYRDNEVGKGHPLMITLNQVEDTRKIKKLHLKPLDLETTCKITEDSLSMVPKAARRLGEMVYSKTKGNPFFTHNFLKSLYDKKVVRTDQAGKWIWNAEEIKALSYTENVIDLMTEGLTDLPEGTQELLKYASVLGNTFSLKDLDSIVPIGSAIVFKELQPAVKEGYLFAPTENSKSLEHTATTGKYDVDQLAAYDTLVFSFGHDKMQQAAYGLIEDSEKAALHLKIARLLVEKWSDGKLQENVFELLNLYAQALHLIDHPKEKLAIAQKCLYAGQKAKDSISYDLGVRFLEMGKKLLPQDSWKTYYELTFNIHLVLGECEYLNDNPKTAEGYFEILLNRSRTKYEKLQVYYLHAGLYLKIGNTVRSLQLGLDAMRLYHIRFPKKKSAIKFAALGKVMKYLFLFSTKYRNPQKTLQKGPCEDKEIFAINKFLVDLSTSAYQQDQNLMMLVILEMVKLYLKHGFTDSTGFGFAGFSTTVLSALKLQKRGFKLWDFTLDLNDRTQSVFMRNRLNYTKVCFYNPWRKPFATGYDEILENIKTSVALGDQIWTGYSVSLYFRIRITAGENLADVLSTSKDHWHLIKNGTVGFDFILGMYEMAKVLSDTPENWDDLDKSQDAFYRLKQEGNNTKLGFYNAGEIALAYFTGNYEDSIAKGDLYQENMLGDSCQAWNAFFTSMAIAVSFGQTTASEQGRNLKIFKAHLKDMKLWAKGCPENFDPYYNLLKAEYLGIKKRWQKAFPFYERAIASAAAVKMRYVEAIANERLVASCEQMGYGQLRSYFVKEAWTAYQRWGAFLKCSQLERLHPAILADKMDKVSHKSSSSAMATNAALDLSSLIKASQSIASKVKFAGLLKTLMHIIIENAGAESGFFLLKKNGKLHLEAKAVSGEKKVLLLDSQPLDAVAELPKSFINYCWRTKETVILDDAMADDQFGADAYVKEKQVLSMMCFPIAALGKVNGLMYLENTVLRGVFDSGRAALLQMLSGQIGISVENALLYQNLEEKVQERTRKIEKTLTELKATQSQLIQSEKMASLGELTAGIAHEIQNPLNFVNNFSELNSELIEEMLEEIQAGNFEEVKALSQDIMSNEKKINLHGKRADAIVKAMLQHSSAQKGQKERVDINALCDEYLRLAYHGLQAKDKKLQVEVIKDFDPNLPKIPMIAGDLGRVLLNLLNNAFYAVKERNDQAQKENDPYVPRVSLSTKMLKEELLIKLEDNGSGIPEEIKEKIFQPFFTTKPAGEGTGLGLSLSYDIIQAHHAKIDVESEKGTGTAFTILFPKEHYL